MKGGKGGKGRQAPQPAAKSAREPKRDGARRGSPKRDWGAIERDAPIDVPLKATKPPPKKPRQ